MRLLVLGGTHHVGRAVVETALDRGDEVTTLNRGLTGRQPPGARALHADRTDPAALLAGRAGHYGYVSSESVYRSFSVPGADESAPVVDAVIASRLGSACG